MDDNHVNIDKNISTVNKNREQEAAGGENILYSVKARLG